MEEVHSLTMYLYWNFLLCSGQHLLLREYHQSLENIINVNLLLSLQTLSSKYIYVATMIGNYLLVMFGIGDGDTGFDDVSLLSTNSWTWVNQYTPNPAWLSGNDSNSLNSSNSGKTEKYTF